MNDSKRTNQMNFFDHLGRIDRRIIYLLLFLAVAVPLMKPLGLPTVIEPMTQQAFDSVGKLKQGDVLVFAMDTSVAYKADLYAGAIAIVGHALDKGARVLIPALVQDGPMVADELVKYFEKKGYKYGDRLVNLGFVPGGETAVAALARDFPATFPKDYYGNSTSGMPAMAGVKTAKDFALVVAAAVNITPGGLDWVKQAQGPYGTPLVFLSGAMLVPQFVPYLQSGQLRGMLKGISGSAQYEMLLGKPGGATASMEGQSMAHSLIIILVVLGNLSYLFGAAARKARGVR